MLFGESFGSVSEFLSYFFCDRRVVIKVKTEMGRYQGFS